MPISSLFTRTNTTSYVPQSLPLNGPDYQVSISNRNPGRTKQITKSGNRIEVRSPNMANNVSLQARPDGVSYSRGNQLPTHIVQRGQNISIQRPGGGDVRIAKNGNSIDVDRPGVSNDVRFTQTSDGLEIDRYSYHNDVKISEGTGGVYFQYGQPAKNTRVALTPGLKLDSVAFSEETTLSPHGLAILSDWFEEGRIDAADLISLTQQGEILEYDGLLR